MDQLFAYHAKWFGRHELPTTESLAQALYLETEQQKQLTIAVNNGICMAIDGEQA